MDGHIIKRGIACTRRYQTGCGSVVVAGNRAFCYVSGCTLAKERFLTDKLLSDLGWMEDVPEGLIKDWKRPG